MRRTALLLLALVALAGCGGDGGSPPAAPEAAPVADNVKELANILDLRSDFEVDAGKTRVILLLSPT
ncbi:MAG: hypothetical protein M3R12_02040 [Actinomycetota bacterium]|nr:hypothetical protein [Actinomycetota bacterium]